MQTNLLGKRAGVLSANNVIVYRGEIVGLFSGSDSQPVIVLLFDDGKLGHYSIHNVVVLPHYSRVRPEPTAVPGSGV